MKGGESQIKHREAGLPFICPVCRVSASLLHHTTIQAGASSSALTAASCASTAIQTLPSCVPLPTDSVSGVQDPGSAHGEQARRHSSAHRGQFQEVGGGWPAAAAYSSKAAGASRKPWGMRPSGWLATITHVCIHTLTFAR